MIDRDGVQRYDRLREWESICQRQILINRERANPSSPIIDSPIIQNQTPSPVAEMEKGRKG